MNIKEIFSAKVSSEVKKGICVYSLAFCVGAVVAGSLFFAIRQPGNGRGGLETPAMPHYTQTQDETPENFDHIAALEKAENTFEDEFSLTYSTYRIKKGDMIGFIAEEYGVTQDTLISVNGIRQSRSIQPGQYLKIPSMPGILYTVQKNGETPESIAQKYQVDAVKCALANNMASDHALSSGSSVFVPDAELDYMTRMEINGDLFNRPIHARYRFSSYFGWRPSPFTGRRSWHGGIDMACPAWTKIYAALGGTVVRVAYSNTYGNFVVIQHHSGYQTLYGHMVQPSHMKVGQYVTPQTVIGYVGSTGASTGPHCHFTIFKNGKMINPINLTRWK